ncbi:MAG: hypothetical protein IT292_12450 [Deltaproteobacteria bacterium]|nr:hypothetical protein [Deltaproteobacteria bacterium]
MKKGYILLLLVSLLVFSGCSSSFFESLDPFNDSDDGNELGQRSTDAIMGAGSDNDQAKKARHALEVMSSYRSAQAPQPYYPVMQPAEVRLMWVPDHLNRSGDLVPAHYYYLKVLPDRWAVEDAFELEKQVSGGTSEESSATPWVYGSQNK